MEYEIKPAEKLSINIKELWEYKELFYFFTWRDIKVKYKQTILGFAWAILQPALMMLVFTFSFWESYWSSKSDKFTISCICIYRIDALGIFSGGLQASGNSMVSNANIIKKIYFPRLIIPLSSILVSVFDFLMTIIPFIALLLYYKISIDWFRLIVFFPLSLIIILFTTFGVGTFLAALNVKYRDFRYILPFMIQFLMFATPVIYPVTIVTNDKIKFLLTLNPMSSGDQHFQSSF